MKTLPPVALGTWSWGTGFAGGDTVFGNHLSDTQMAEVFTAAMSKGLNLWDTAAVYGMGSSETALGALVRQFPRENIILSTKFTPQIADKQSAQPVSDMLEASLGRLGVDAIDIYWIHNPLDVEKWTPGLIPLLQSGKVKRVGVSNHNLAQIRRANEILNASGYSLSAVQNHYSLLYRASEEAGILDYCRQNNITFFAYMVLEQGALSGRYDSNHPMPAGSGRAESYNAVLPQIERLTAAMKKMGAERNASVAQIAIAWAIAKGTLPLVGATNLGLFGAFSFDITQANTTLADGTRHSGQSIKSVYSKSFYQTGTNIQVAGYRYSTQGFYNLSDSAYSRMSGYTVKPPTGDSNEQTQFIDYFNLFYSKRGQEQISISQQLGNYGTTFFSASRQSYWNTSRSDQQISFGLNVPFGDITTSLNYSYSNNIWQNDRDHLLAFTLNVPFSHWMRTDSQSAFRNSNASYSMSNDLKGGMTNLSGVYGTLLPDNNLNYSVQVGNTHGGNTSSATSGYSSLNYRGAYGNTNVGYSRSGDSSQIYYGMSGGIIAHADGITFGQPLGDTMVLVKAPGADNVKIENQTGIHTDWRGYAILPFATEYRENRVALNANSLADNVELDETVVTVIPTHGAIARATFNAQIGGKVLMTLKYGNKSVPFGAIVIHGENKNGSIVAENGQVYLTGLPQSGKLQVSWGKDKNSNCIVEYKLPEVSPGTLLNQQTAICR
ncbi:hypothetical protein D9E08_16410 [Escherichia coli]|nr:hypothetical protein [Escherichia coli]